MKNENIIYFAFMDYDVNKQREQQEVERFSKKNRILFIEKPFSLFFFFLNKNKRNKKNLKKITSWKQGAKRCSNSHNLYFYTPRPSWYPLTRVPLINKLYYKLFINDLKKIQYDLKFEKPLLWITQPPTFPVINHFHEKCVIADWCNTWEEWFAPILLKGWWWKGLRKINLQWKRYWITKILKKADIVLVSAIKYYNYAKKYNNNVHFFPNGADIKTFISHNDHKTIPDDLKSIKTPRLGIMSANINKLVVDINLIKLLSQSHPKWSIVFVGKINGNIENIDKLKNVYFFGSKSHPELPKYLQNCDVNLIPYNLKEGKTLTQSGIPTKLPEYLSVGKPVVSVYLEEIEKIKDFKNVVYLAKNQNDFLKKVEQAMIENNEKLEEKRKFIAQKYDWDKIVNQMENKIEIFLTKKYGTQGNQ